MSGQRIIQIVTVPEITESIGSRPRSLESSVRGSREALSQFSRSSPVAWATLRVKDCYWYSVNLFGYRIRYQLPEAPPPPKLPPPPEKLEPELKLELELELQLEPEL